MKVKLICKRCGKEFFVKPSRQNSAKFCSRECADTARKEQHLNCVCTQCGKKFYMPPYQMRSTKRTFGYFCSVNCLTQYRKIHFCGEKNHQWGLKGELNASFKRNVLTKRNGHLLEETISCPERPDTINKSSRMTLHRYNVVTNWEKFDPILFNKIDDFYVLKDNLQVHHIDFDHTNNDLSNLTVLTKSAHLKVHNQIKELALELASKLIGVLKQGELLENPGVDNQQPSLNSNIFEGSETNAQVPTDYAVDSNSDTSALLYHITNMVNDYIVQTRTIAQDGYNLTISEILESEINNSEIKQNEL